MHGNSRPPLPPGRMHACINTVDRTKHAQVQEWVIGVREASSFGGDGAGALRRFRGDRVGGSSSQKSESIDNSFDYARPSRPGLGVEGA